MIGGDSVEELSDDAVELAALRGVSAHRGWSRIGELSGGDHPDLQGRGDSDPDLPRLDLETYLHVADTTAHLEDRLELRIVVGAL